MIIRVVKEKEDSPDASPIMLPFEMRNCAEDGTVKIKHKHGGKHQGKMITSVLDIMKSESW